jgi:hypothetical protein
MTKMEKYLVDALASFESDPPDTDYQRGYRAALCELARAIETSSSRRRSDREANDGAHTGHHPARAPTARGGNPRNMKEAQHVNRSR